MKNLNITYLLLGSNLGNRYNYLQLAKKQILLKVGEIISESEIYETEPVGFISNNNFLNQVLKVSTVLLPHDLLYTILETEQKLGRIREEGGYSSRTIDIDILYYNNEIVSDKRLVIPHPRIHERKFTLLPLTDIAPEFVHPVIGQTQLELLSTCNDSSTVNVYYNNEA